MLQDSVEPQGDPALPVEESSFKLPPVAGFWRRFFAWAIDSLILGIIGQIICIPFSSFFFELGPYGRPIGLLFILPYFGILNSSLGGGQTFGKRLLKIAVRNKDNKPIHLGRSILRITIIVLPALFNNWQVPIYKNWVIIWLLYLLEYGLGGAILYTMIFNRKARQGIHDLIVGTYVVHVSKNDLNFAPTTPKIHRTILLAWIGFVAVGALIISFVIPALAPHSPNRIPERTFYDDLQEDPRFFSATLGSQTYSSAEKSTYSLIVTLWYKGKISDINSKEIID